MRLIQGDCLEEMKTIESGSVDMVLTDPPYEMTKRGKAHRPDYMTLNKAGNFFEGKVPDTSAWMGECYRVLKPDAHFYTFVNTRNLQSFLVTAEKVGFKLHNVLTMIKDTKMPTQWYLKYTELILFFRKGKAVPINDGTSRDYEFVEMPTLRNGKVHKTQKPLSIIEKLITNSSNEGDTVLDPFAGSGTAGVACANLNRDFIGIELDADYYKIADKRIEDAVKAYTQKDWAVV